MRYLALWTILLLTACDDAPPSAPAKPVATLAAPSLMTQQKNCIACHNATSNMVGPAWKNIAAKYQGDASAATLLTEKVLKGGSGSFGAVVMPPQSVNLSPEEAQHLVQWILKGAPN